MGENIEQVLQEAAAVLDRLAAFDLDQVIDHDLTAAVMCYQACRARLEAGEARVLNRFEASGVWRDSGAKSAPAWIAWQQHIPIETARQRVKHARGIRDLPAVGEAWAAGEIDRTHVTTILGARNPRTESAFMGDGDFAEGESGHEVLLDHARSMPYTSFKRICDRWQLVVDPDGAEQKAAANHAARDASLAQSYGGMYYGRITLDPVNGQIVADTLAEIERELFRSRLGRRQTAPRPPTPHARARPHLRATPC